MFKLKFFTALMAASILIISSPYCIAQSAAIKAGHTLDPGSGLISENQWLIVRDGKIERISERMGEVAGLPVIDLSDSWVLPGLMDTHVHITWNVAEFGTPKWHEVNITESTTLRALRGLAVAREFLSAGFTTIKEIGNDADYATADIIKAIANGWHQGPTIQYAGKIIAPYGGQIRGVSFRNEGYWNYEYLDADTADEIVKAIRKNIFFGADTIKLVSDTFAYYYSRNDIAIAVAEAAMAGLKVTVHVMGGEAAREVILGGAAGIEHGFELDESLLKLMKKHGTFLISTDFSYENFRAYGDSEEAARKKEEKMVQRLKNAYDLGVKLAYGTDIVINLPDRNRVESSFEVLEVWKKAGIPAMAVLKAMTSNAAELMGMEKDRGHLVAGFEADIVAFRSNPLEAIDQLRKAHFVMKSGIVFRHD